MADYASYDSSKSKPAGSKLANELGIYDMSGNAWEWCSDRGAGWPAGQVTDYRGGSSGYQSMVHGGCFTNPYYNCALAVRVVFGMSAAYRDVGFRVVRR